jgi:DNA-binding GntR family transcriptional regulator
VPSITTLSREFVHARPTCGKALQLLEHEGLLIRVAGLGYYVARVGELGHTRAEQATERTAPL